MSELPARSKARNIWGKISYWGGLGIVSFILWVLFSYFAIYLPSLWVGKFTFPDQMKLFALTVTQISLKVTGPAFLAVWVTFPKSDHAFLKYLQGSLVGELIGFICICFFSYLDLSGASRLIALFTLIGAVVSVFGAKILNHWRWHAR